MINKQEAKRKNLIALVAVLIFLAVVLLLDQVIAPTSKLYMLLTVLQKLRCDDAAALPADEVLKIACCGSAEAMGLTDCGSIAVGNAADLTVIGLKRPSMQPINNIAKNLVYSGSKENVRMTVIAGEVRYFDGEFFVGEDTARIYARCNELCEALKKR